VAFLIAETDGAIGFLQAFNAHLFSQKTKTFLAIPILGALNTFALHRVADQSFLTVGIHHTVNANPRALVANLVAHTVHVARARRPFRRPVDGEFAGNKQH